MKLSIITTVYQAEKDLPRLLDSMMAQKSPELEFFLIDNGCTDGSAKICAEYAARDSRFKIHTLKENIGYIAARNLGLDTVDADYIGFCDSDDYLEPGGYDRALEKIKESECDIYLTSYNTIYNSQLYTTHLPYKPGKYQGKDTILKEILPLAFGPIDKRGMLHGFMWKEIFRLSILRKNDLKFDESLQPYEDQLQNVRFLKLCDSVLVDNSPIYNYIVNEKSITSSIQKNFNVPQEWNRIILLYEQKKHEAINDESMSANLNASYQYLISLILSLSKHTKHPIKYFSEIKDSHYLSLFLYAPIAQYGFRNWIIRALIKHNLSCMLFQALKLIRK